MTDLHAAAIEADERARLTVKHETDRTLFVEAGAGTGKTTALVGRIVQLVLAPDPDERVPLSEIAAITFTEAAAAELRERIRAEFEAALTAARRSGDDDTAAACETALADADLAAISTLHAFAQRLLAEHPVDVGIPPRVEVIDEVQSQIAFEDRWSEFVDEVFNDDEIETFVVRASILNVGIGSRTSPLRTIAQIFDDNWDRLEGIEATAPPAAPVDFTPINDAIVRILAARADCSDPDDRMHGNIDKAEPLLQRFLTSRSETERLRMLVKLKVSTAHGKAGNWPSLDAVKEDAKAVAERAAEVHGLVANQTLQLLAARIAVFVKGSAEQRRAEGTLEFHDLLVLARTLLRTSPVARANLAARYRVLMLDEFQDTDPIQIELALLLAGSVTGPFTGKWEELHAEEGRLFMVGDPKQSIYRFRRADIDLFHAVQERFASGQVALTRNFRTVAPIIDAVNGIFSERMDGSDRAQATYSPLVPHRTGPADHRPAVFGGPSTRKAGELRTDEANDVASIVAAIRDDPGAWPVFDRTTEEWRPPKLRDITVLLPTRTSLRQLSDALDAQQIPFRADTGTLVYETQEVRDLLVTLRAVDDPSDQVALVAALRSPLYACGDDDLFRWKHGGGAFDIRSGWPEELDDSPVATAFRHLRTLADLRWGDEPSRLLQRLIDDRRAFVLPASGRRPRDTWRRLRYLVDQARAFAESDGGDLRAWLKWTSLQGLDGSKAHEPMLPELDDDAVQIMTIHGSKGLEFPITIVSGLTTDLGRRHGHGVDVAWTEPGTVPEVAINKNLRTAQFDLANDLEAEMARPEKDRLLYVALTRARDHLVISAHHPVDVKGKARDSHGATIHGFATESMEAAFRPALGQGTLFATPTPIETTPTVSTFRIPDGWERNRRNQLAAAGQTTVRSATALARAVRDDLELDASDEQSPMDEIDDEAALPPQTFRRGRAGTAIGSAVHAVLQFVDLTDPDDATIDDLVTAQAWAESVPEHEETIARSVRSALAADIVQACRTARHWKELYVAAPVGGFTVEGYVDLLVEREDGLVVVDYKTDSVTTEADIDRKLDGYAMQGAAYAAAIEIATGRPVADVQFVFARPAGPVVRSVSNLDELRDRIAVTAERAGAVDPPPEEPLS
jgi:ATP-dependent exoDNAse (exonuclease V) beta subunit